MLSQLYHYLCIIFFIIVFKKFLSLLVIPNIYTTIKVDKTHTAHIKTDTNELGDNNLCIIKGVIEAIKPIKIDFIKTSFMYLTLGNGISLPTIQSLKNRLIIEAQSDTIKTTTGEQPPIFKTI